MFQRSALRLTNPYKLVFYETDDELQEISKEIDCQEKDRFEQYSDLDYEISDSSENLENTVQLDHNNNKLNSLQQYDKRKRRQLPKIPENKQPLTSIGSKSKTSEMVRQISSTLSLHIKLNEYKKPISLQLIDTNHDLKQSNETLKDDEEIDYRPLSEQLNCTSPMRSFNKKNNDNKIEGNYRGLHRFIARHPDEISIDIGDSIYVIKQEDDLWFKGINLATNTTGYFPSLYVIDCNYKELFQTVNYFGSSDNDSGLNCSNEFDSIDWIDIGKECFKEPEKHFYLKFLGSVEVFKLNGNQVLEQSIKKVIQTYNKQTSKKPSIDQNLCPFLCILEIGSFGVHFYNHQNQLNEPIKNESDFVNTKTTKKTEVDENWVNIDEFDIEQETNKSNQPNFQIKNKQDDYFFHLKNITFCGSQDHYFAFITQHPKIKNRYATHVFDASDADIAKDICESIGNAFHRFYLNYIELSQIFND